MVQFKDIKFDCRLYNGYKPCIYGNECAGCPWYTSYHPDSPGWFPSLTSGAIAQLPEAPRIIIIKTGALGDVLRTTTILHPLRRAFPRAHITWITAPPALPLLTSNPLIDELTAFDGDAPPPLLNEHFDLSICLEKEGYPLLFGEIVKATHKTGYSPTPWAKAAVSNKEAEYMLLLGLNDELKFYLNKLSYPQIICEATGLQFQRDPYILETTETGRLARERVREALQNRGANPDLPVIGLNTGCGPVFRTKQWTLEGWADTARQLHDSGRANVVLMGGEAETELNHAIMEQVPGLLDTGTRNSLEEFFGIVDACDIVITSDTLGMHIAIARKKYVVALFGPTSHHEIDLYDRGEKIVTTFACSPCYLKSCELKQTCMEALEASTVLAAASRGITAMAESGRPL